jgi:GDPmannose 4,6-dehydratase
MKTALITGITGQDGSYLAEFLLERGYHVVGMLRRLSLENYGRIEHLIKRIEFAQGDLLDQASLSNILREYEPDEVYNLAAMSFVPTSWNQPVLTGEFTAIGVTRVLDAIRMVDRSVRFYQASSSEMFGKVRETPQNETTPFYPRSPYGVAKVYGHYITVNYRESYDIYAVSGILFNHECVTAETPVFVRRDGLLDLVPIEDIVPHRTQPHTAARFTTQPTAADPLEVWDAHGWAPVTCMTATWNGFERKPNKTVYRIIARGAFFEATSDHVVIVEAGESCREVPTCEVHPDESLALVALPEPTEAICLTDDEAWLLGILAAEGHVGEDGQVRVSNQDSGLLDEVAACWRRVSGGTTSRYVARSGFERGRDVTQLRLTGAGAYGRFLRESLYTRSHQKRVPKRILNTEQSARLAFLRGFNRGDGLRSTPCTHEFQGFKTSSAVLASGLYWMATTTLKQRAIICPEDRQGRLYFQVNLNSPNVPGQKGQHLRRALAKVIKVEPVAYSGWLFDLATTTGTFHAGIGQGWIHNSPRRGMEFVTRKVSDGVARIALGLNNTLPLGNLESRRDWGYAGDYVRAMWMMLQRPEPTDYVIATGESHSVRELVDLAFSHVGLDPAGYVTVEPHLLRPADIDHLVGDSTKARLELGWRPEVSFEQLVKRMVDADVERLKQAIERGGAVPAYAPSVRISR